LGRYKKIFYFSPALYHFLFLKTTLKLNRMIYDNAYIRRRYFTTPHVYRSPQQRLNQWVFGGKVGAKKRGERANVTDMYSSP